MALTEFVANFVELGHLETCSVTHSFAYTRAQIHSMKIVNVDLGKSTWPIVNVTSRWRMSEYQVEEYQQCK